MNSTGILEEIARPARIEAVRALNVAVIYADAPARDWAMELCRQMEEVAGEKAVRSTWWESGWLNDPEVRAAAVPAAARADVIVVSIYEANGRPLHLCAWNDTWRPHHHLLTMALIALISQALRQGARYFHSPEYLRAIARKNSLDFLLRENVLPLNSRGFLYREAAADRADTVSSALPQTHGLEQHHRHGALECVAAGDDFYSWNMNNTQPKEKSS